MTTPQPPLAAHRVRSRAQWILLVGAGAGIAWAGYRILTVATGSTPVLCVYAAFIAVLVWQLVVAAFDRPMAATPHGAAALKEASVAVLIPAYNEDSATLRANVEALLRQSHLPTAICIVDDGSTVDDYADARDWFLHEAPRAGVVASWQRQENAGKRSAQITAARAFPDADFYLTVDSDTQLDRHAVEEILQPFDDPQVQSVAGTILVTNYRTNLLTRMQEVWFVTMQSVERAALSRAGAVLVNSGGLAAYRADVLWDNVEHYLTETFRGRPVHCSDDSLLTLYSQQRGRTVHQPSAFAFTNMPSTFDGHRRQQLRWMRGSFLRSGTRFRDLPANRFAYWYHLVRWAQYAAAMVLLIGLGVTGTLIQPAALLTSIVIVAAVHLIIASSYLTLRRNDQTLAQRLLVAACAPIVGLWCMTVLRVLRWYAMATVGNASWGTRKKLEVID